VTRRGMLHSPFLASATHALQGAGAAPIGIVITK